MKLRILVAGGCHVVGYPIGEQFSFPSVARDTLALRGTEIEWRTMARVPIKHVKCLMDAVSSRDKEYLEMRGGHISVFSGRQANKVMWPKLDEWLTQRSL